MLSAYEAVALCRLLEQHRIRFWVMGGWGVDALLHRETRPHKDLDILVVRGDLPLLWKLLNAHGFTLHYVWQENRWLEGEPDRWPTAFVDGGRTGPRAGRPCHRHRTRRRHPPALHPAVAVPCAITGQGTSATRRSPASRRRRNCSCTPGTPCPKGSNATSNSCKGTDTTLG